jgi:integrase
MADLFSKTAIKALLKGGEARIHWDDKLVGFGLRIYPSGEASYLVDFRLKGSRAKRRIVLGKTAALSPEKARSRASDVLEKARKSVDLDKQERAAVAWAEAEERRKADALTVKQAVKRYLDTFGTAPSKRTGRRPAASSVRQAGVWLKPLVETSGLTALESLSAEAVKRVLDATPEASRRNVFGAIKRLVTHYRRAGLVTTSPLESVDPPPQPKSRDRTPSPAEVKTILKAADALLESGRWARVQRDGIWLVALTAQRRAEVAAMAWEDLDLDAADWRQPGAKNKTGKPHVVPLAGIALDILKRAHTAAGRPSEGLVLRGVRGGGRMDANLSDLQQVLRKETGIAFRLHDFRRSAVSAMAENGVDFAVADAILNHAAAQSRAGMIAVYQHAELKGTKRRAMEIWEAALFPATAVAAAKVVSIRNAGGSR